MTTTQAPSVSAQRNGWRGRAAWLAITAWTGALLLLSLVVAPTAFDVLPRDVAGRLMARLFAVEAPVSCAVALIGLLAQRRAQADAWEEGRPAGVLTIDLVLLVVVLFCTVAGYYGVQPLMGQARSGHATGGLSFGALHGVSMALFGVKLASLVLLSWRLSRR